MKKLISFTMAVLMISAMAVTAFADVDPSYAGFNNNAVSGANNTANRSGNTANDTNNTTNRSGNTVNGANNTANGSNNIAGRSNNMTNGSDTIFMPETAALPSTFSNDPVLSLGNDADGVALENAILTPGKEYRFPLMITTDTTPEAVTEATLDTYNVRFTAKKGSSTISSISLVKYSGEYNVVINTKTAWPTTTTEVQYEIRLVSRTNGSTVDTLTVNFETGYQKADDATINSLSSGDEIIVDNDRPVYTKSQLERIASVNNYRNVTFVGSNWRYTTNVSDMSAINLLFNHNGITELLGTYPDHDFEFVNFPSGPSFSINGRFEVDVTDFGEDFNNYYVYRYLNGKITELTSTYNEDDETLNFNTSTLGRFVISDRPIDTTATEVPTPEDNVPPTTTQPGPTVPNDDKYNPGTGAIA